MNAQEKKNMDALAVIAALDAALTLAEKLTTWLQNKREVGELTPEEEAQLDERLERTFASWQRK